jgi:hypothetical protein
MSVNNISELSPYYLGCSDFRELLVQVPATERDADPEIFEQLSRAAANIAELLRDWHRKRTERVSALSAKISEIFPELMEKTAAEFARVEDDALDSVETAVQSVTEASGRLAASESKARAALDNRDYSSVGKHASRAGKYQAAILVQREYLVSLLASLSRDGYDRAGADLGLPLRLAFAAPSASADDQSAVADLDRRHELAPSAAKSSVIEQTGAAPEPKRASARRSEPEFSSARGFDSEANGEAADVAPLSDRAASVASPDEAVWEVEPAATRLAVSPKPLEPSEIVPSPPSVEAVDRALWSALAQGRLGLAQGLLEVGALNGKNNLLGPAIELAAMAMVADTPGEIVDAARETAGRVLTAWQSEDASAQVSPETALAAAVMLLPASILLALVAPGSDQAGLLSALPNYSAAPVDWQPARRLPSLCAMARKTAEAIAVIGGEFLPVQEQFVDLISREEWTAELRRHCESVKSWVDAQLARTLRNSAATNVWHALIRSRRVLGQLFTIVIEDRALELDWVRREILGFRPLAVIREVEMDVRGTVARRKPIEGPVLQELEHLVEEALQLIRSWVELRTQAGDAAALSRAQPVAELRTTLGAGLAEAEAEVRALAGVPGSGVGVAGRILSRLAALVNGRLPKREADTPDELLGRDLFGLPQIEFDLNWRRARPLPSNIMPELLRLCDAEVDPLAAGRARISRLDFVGGELAWRLVEKRQNHDETEAEGLRSEIRKDADDTKDTALRIRHWRGLRQFGEILRRPSGREEAKSESRRS